jgi:hypothetical protein
MKSFRRSIKAVSPVIATIIIVAIAITMSIAVAYWLLGLGSSFTKFEKVEFTTGYADTSGSGYTLSMDVKNTGSATATIDPTLILYNGKPSAATSGAVATCTAGTGIVDVNGNLVLDPGKDGSISVALSGGNWTSGMTVEVILHSTGGKDYPRAFILP